MSDEQKATWIRYSRSIVASPLGPRDGHGAHRAGVGDALQRRRVLLLLHKSDHGSQHVATACQQRLTAYGIYCSVTLKTELVYMRRFQTLQDARMENLEGFYNRQYRHFTLDYLGPVEVEERPGLVIH